MRVRIIVFLVVAAVTIGCQAGSVWVGSEKNLVQGIELSKQLSKPIFLHFTCYDCMGYNEFYNDLLTTREVLNTLKEDFVVIELYVDDRKEIEPSDTLNLYKIKFSDEVKERITKAKTIGGINRAIETEWLHRNNQPLYLVIDSEQNILVTPFEYTNKDSGYFLTKLNDGLEKSRKGE